jgi:hypothetical protein
MLRVVGRNRLSAPVVPRRSVGETFTKGEISVVQEDE